MDDPANTGGYQVWWSAEPYFTPGATGSDYALASAPPYTDGGAAGTTKYYTVLGVNETGQTVSESSGVGVFSFALATGGGPPELPA